MGTIVIMAIYAVAIGLLFAAKSTWAAVSFAVLFGSANASHTVLPPLYTSACTGLEHFALIFGVLNVAINLGSGIGMPLSGYIYDAYGSYFLAFALYIVLIIITALAGVAAFRKRPVRAV